MATEATKTESNSAKATSDEDKKETPAAAPALHISLQGVLIQPRVSEKAGKMAQFGKYVFLVSPSANKITVKKAVEHSYKVKVIQVNIISMKGKHRTFGKTSGTTSNYKKAIVTLKEGDKIEGATETI